MTELLNVIHSVCSAVQAVLSALSRRADLAEECLSHQAREIAALTVSAESARTNPTRALEWLSLCEAVGGQLKREMTASQPELTQYEITLIVLDRTAAPVSEIKTDLEGDAGANVECPAVTHHQLTC
jgi:hypothetical protein